MILHAHLGKDWKVLHNDSIVLDKLVVFQNRLSLNFLKDEELVLLLLVHNQVLATDDGHPILVKGFHKTDHFIGLTSFCYKKLDWDFSAPGEVLIIKHDDLVNLGNEHQV